MITIRFSGRSPTPRQTQLAVEGDHYADTVRFLLPDVAGTAYLHLVQGNGRADVLPIVENVCEIDGYCTATPGIARGYVEIMDGLDKIWHSEIIFFTVDDLPDIDAEIAQQYPTAIQEALDDIEDMKDDAEAAAVRAEAAEAATRAVIPVVVENADGTYTIEQTTIEEE